MNCEMAQRTIALAALAPALPPHTSREVGSPASNITSQVASPIGGDRLEEEALARMEAELFGAGDADHPDLPGSSAAFYGPTNLDALNHPLEPSTPGDFDLPENERLALEEHLAHCRECQAEMAATSAFYRALSLARYPEPTPSLLARARLRLDATLDSHAHQSAVAHLLQQLSFSAGRLRAAPGLASGLLLVGLATGGYAGYRAGHAVHNQEQGTLVMQQLPAIDHVSSIVQDPDSEQVVVHYDRLEPDTFSGSLDDPAIRQLLMFAMQHGADPEVRNNSFDLLAAECRHGHGCNGGPVRNALLSVLHTDRNPQVRIEALGALEPYIAEDLKVRDAVVRAMMADTNAEVRIEAVRLLTPVEVDSSVRQALHTVASHDGDPVIRTASQQMLNEMPQVQ